MKDEVIVVEAEEVMEPIIQDYQKYELDKSMAIDLAKGLPQVLSERATLLAQVDEVLAMDKDDPRTAKKAAELRIAIKNNRTKGVEKWRKTSGEVFLRAKQFVDAIGKKEIFINEQAEGQLEAIERYHENLEKQRLETLHQERLAMVAVYVDDVSTLPNLSGMDQEIFEAYLQTKKNTFEAKIAAEKKAEEERLERERIQNLHNERFQLLLPYWQFVTEKEINFGVLPQEQFESLLAQKKVEAVNFEKEQERIRLENERLKKEAEAEAEKLRLFNEKVKKDLEIAEAAANAERDKIEAAMAEERKVAQEKADKERKEKEALEAELQKKKDQEQAELATKQAAEEAEKQRLVDLSKAGDKAILVEFLEKSFVTPKSPDGLTESGNAKILEIVTKFGAFRSWALKQIETL
jgi:hypothetical protein